MQPDGRNWGVPGRHWPPSPQEEPGRPSGQILLAGRLPKPHRRVPSDLLVHGPPCARAALGGWASHCPSVPSARSWPACASPGPRFSLPAEKAAGDVWEARAALEPGDGLSWAAWSRPLLTPGLGERPTALHAGVLLAPPLQALGQPAPAAPSLEGPPGQGTDPSVSGFAPSRSKPPFPHL